MKPSCNINSSIEDWLILSDYYEDIKYDNVIEFIKTTIIEWIEWLNKYKYEPIYTGSSYAWINKVLMRQNLNCYLRGKLYYKICPMNSHNYRPEIFYDSKEQAYLDLFLAYLECK